MGTNYRRGSEWRKWDLHIHSPASFNWSAPQKLHHLDAEQKETVLGAMVDALNEADASVFSIMDYWTFDGVLALRDFSRNKPGQLKKTVFPGIELRVQAPTTERLDIHVIFSEEIADQRLRDFLTNLRVQLIGGGERPLSRDCLIEYARSLRPDQLALHGFDSDRIAGDDEYAWEAGSQTCEVTLESFRKAMSETPDGMAVVYQPWDTYHGLIDLKWQRHYTAAYRLFSQPDIFECKGPGYRAAFQGIKNSDNEAYFDGFWEALEDRPRLAVRGSDAHKFEKYGKFQSNLTTWIKAAPTFKGLLQAIREPSQRSWLGEEPPKLIKKRTKPTVFIDRVSLRKTPGGGLSQEDWFDNQDLPLNSDLVAIIGSKGSGKSALADIIGLLGDTSNTEAFSFLNTKRFRERKNNRSLHFEGELTWADGESNTRKLSEDPEATAVERVRYIPQEYFEKVCAGQSEVDIAEFTRQIERVIFSYVPRELRGESSNLKDLLRQQEEEAHRNLERLRTEVRRLNDTICDIRRRSTSNVRAELQGQLNLRKKQLEDLENAQPALPEAAPSESEAGDPSLVRLQDLEKQKSAVSEQIAATRTKLADLQRKAQAATRIAAGVKNLEESVSEVVNHMRPDAELLEIDLSSFIKLEVSVDALGAKQTAISEAIRDENDRLEGPGDESLAFKLDKIHEQIRAVKTTLDAKQLERQAAMDRHRQWQEQVAALTGPKDLSTSINHIQAQVDWIDHAPSKIVELEVERLRKATEIADQLQGVRESREALVDTIEGTIAEVIPDRNDFSLGFVNELFVQDLEERFFEHIKQVSGSFRGEDEGRRYFRELVDEISLSNVEGIIAVPQRLEDAVTRDVRDGRDEEIELESQLRKGKTPEELLNLLYCLEYVQPRFSLALAGQPLTQLSPGQRGALLLVFYLLVEDSDIPIVLDQPEENLDNETVYSLLVNVIKKAKERRQIIMVTHNANLAVCCDAEQVIHASLDKANKNKVTYSCGPIEEPEINQLVVDVLEGTRPAFDNRKQKYEVSAH
ncbi:TrlF family AAA-like ATPase [Thiosocius teredinicola]|uniref:TrlF family AAA-like ATPase n=1 Tax=Thiosocius teredinicola TaxID=1973002 RepID=UPI000F7810BC